MPYRYKKRGGGGRCFYVHNTGFANKTLFRAAIDYEQFIEKLKVTAAKNSDCRVVAYCLSRSGYFLILEEGAEGAIARFMHRLAVAYAMYFNNKYHAEGKLFAGPYKDQQLETSEDVLLRMARMARLPECLGIEPDTYKWSSLSSYLTQSDGWLAKDIVRHYFNDDDPHLFFEFTKMVEREC